MSLEHLKSLNVLIATPSNGLWYEPFGTSLLAMAQFYLTRKVGQYKSQSYRFISLKGSLLPNMRAEAVRVARGIKASHLLWIDSDQTFPPQMLHHLIEHDKDVIGANVATKQIPAQPTARNFDPAFPNDATKTKPVYTEWGESKGPERVDWIGCGVLMLSRKAYESLPDGCFAMPYIASADRYQGEDWSMCNALREAGFEIFIDHTLSHLIGHVGSFKYTHEWVGELKDNEPQGEASNG